MRTAASWLSGGGVVAAMAAWGGEPVALDQKPGTVDVSIAFDEVPTAALRVLSFNIRCGIADDGENSWPASRDAVIDTIFASKGWAAFAAGIDRRPRGGRYPSDHFPVFAVLAMPDAAGE